MARLVDTTTSGSEWSAVIIAPQKVPHILNITILTKKVPYSFRKIGVSVGFYSKWVTVRLMTSSFEDASVAQMQKPTP